MRAGSQADLLAVFNCQHTIQLLGVCAAEMAAPRDPNKRLLLEYSEAVRVREAYVLTAALQNSLARFGMERQRLEVVRIMAGLTDPNVAALRDITSKLCVSAQNSRCVGLGEDVPGRVCTPRTLPQGSYQAQSAIQPHNLGACSANFLPHAFLSVCPSAQCCCLTGR